MSSGLAGPAATHQDTPPHRTRYQGRPEAAPSQATGRRGDDLSLRQAADRLKLLGSRTLLNLMAIDFKCDSTHDLVDCLICLDMVIVLRPPEGISIRLGATL